MTNINRLRFPILLVTALALLAILGALFLPDAAQAQEGSAPDKPKGLSATATHDQVVLSWDEPGDDSITGYVILRRIPGVDPQDHFNELVSDTETDATTYTDDTVSAETRYTYRIKAINEHGVSERFRWSHVDVPAAPEAAEGDGEGDGRGAPGGPGKKANVAEPSDGDCAASASTTCEVDVGGSVTGNIGTETDEDWFKVVLEANKSYQIDMKGEGGDGGTLEDPNLRNIRSADGTQITGTGNDDADDENDILDSQIIFTPTTAGTYYLVATTADDTGTYTLSVREVPCTLNEGDIWCGVVDVGEVKSSADVLSGHGFIGVTNRETGGLAGSPDDTMFSVGDNEYTIQGIYVGAGANNEGALYFFLTADLSDHDKEILVLTFEGVATPRPLDDASKLSATGLYNWSTDLDWSSTTEVTVRLQTPDDCPDGTTTTCEVEVGGSATGNIELDNDVDWFKVVVDAGTRYQVDLEGADTGRGTLVDPSIAYIANSVGDVVADTGGTDSGVGKNDRMIFTATADAVYYAAVLSDEHGTYTLSVIVLGANGASEADTDFPSTTATTGRVEVGASATGYMDRGTDFDWFRVDLEADKTYQIDLEGSPTGRGSLGDPFLQIFDASGSNKLTEDNNDGTGANAQIVYTATATGAHYLTAQTLPTETGTYTLSVRDITPPTLSIADAEGDEDDGVEFTATLTAAVSEKVTATWTASIESGDTASAADLATTKTGDVEFEADATEATFTVPVNDDTTDEDNETFTVTLSAVSDNAQLATDPTATGTIVDDDVLGGTRLEGEEFDLDSDNVEPRGIWSDGITIWVADNTENAVYAYALADGTRQDGTNGTMDREFDLHSDNTAPQGIWSDLDTLWVADSGDDKLYAYALADGTRQDGTGGTTDREFDLHSDNGDPRGMWSDGTTVWVGHDGLGATDNKAFAYTLADGSRDSDKDIDFHSSNFFPTGIWSDGATMWVTNNTTTTDKVFAYALSGGARQDGSGGTTNREFDLHSDNTVPQGVWSDYDTMWVADSRSDRLFAYSVSRVTGTPPDRDGVVTLSPTSPGLGVEITATLADADGSVSGASWQWSSADSASGTFTNIPGATTEAYTTVAADIGKYLKATVSYTDGHGSGKSADATTGDAVSRRLPGSEFDTLDAASNDNPRGIWSNGTTVWVADFSDDKLYAYKMSDTSRDSGEDFDLHSSNGYPNAIWSNGTTMWVTDSAGDKLFAYKMSDKSSDSGEDFDTLEAAGNDDPRGLWSDGTTMWVTDTEDKEIYAYKMSDKSRDSGKDFDTLDAAGNDKPRGIWSDGTTMWVADSDDGKVYAYKMSDKSRDSGKDFDLHSENTASYGIWSDYGTLWVVDNDDKKLYAYYVSDLTVNTALSGIEVNGTRIPGFVQGDTEPQYGVASTVSDAAIVATAQAASAIVSYSGTDADSNTTAHDTSLSDGANTVTITVTDKGESADYTLSVNRAVTDRYGWKADSDFDTLKLNDIRTPRGIWSDGTDVWVADTDDRKVYAYNTDGTRDSSEGFSIGRFSNGIWGDGTTLWAASSGSDKLFAYRLATGASDSGKDFDTLDAAGNDDPRGIWSDETTMWVSDKNDKKIYAYKMSDMSRDSGKDFDTLDAAGNDDPRGIWSDETTMWVADGDDGKVYAYKMSDKSRDSGKDFDTLDDAGNDDPKGMWSDGTTMWVTDDDDDKVYAYNLQEVGPVPAAPGKPTNLMADAHGGTRINLSWDAPADDGGSAITGYRIEVSDDGSTGWSDLVADTGNDATSYTHQRLSSGDTRHYRVSAINQAGTSEASDVAHATTATPPTCTLNTGDIWCGVLTVAALGESEGFAVRTGDLSDKTFSVGGRNYTIDQVSVTNSTAPNPGTLHFNLGLNTNLTAADRTRLELHVDGNSDTFAFSAATAAAHVNEWTGTSLDWSSATFVTLRLRLAPEAPGKPTNLSATADGGTRIDLSWDAPADDGGSAITGYRIEVSDDGSSGSWSDLVADTGNDGTSYTHTGLSEGDTRHYRVSAINGEGTSVASDVADATTAAAGTCMLNPGDLWCGVVTVGSGSDYFGYDFQPTPVVGGLSDDDFEVGTNSYTIWAIFVGAGTWLNPGSLNFTFASNTRPSAADRDNLVLHVGSAAYRFSDVTPVAGRAFDWTDAGLDWSSETSVTLRLREREDPAADASLSALTVAHSGGSVELSPTFAPETKEYTASVANAVDEVTVAAEANAAGATLAYLDGDGAEIADADTGTPGREVALEVGVETLVQVKVTATDGDATRTYQVRVTRLAADASGEEGEFRLNPDMEEPYEDPAQDRYGGKQSRLEVFHAGRWGTVCSDRFKGSDTTTHPSHGNLAPKLACQAMNYDDGEYASGYGTSEPHQSEADQDNYLRPGGAYPASGPLPIWLDDLMCWTRAEWEDQVRPPSDQETPEFLRLMFLEDPDKSLEVPENQGLGTPYVCAYAGWGLHNRTHREDAGVRCWYDSEQSAQNSERALKGRFLLSPQQHDGSKRVTVKVAFSEPIDETPEGLRNHGVRVEGGEVTAVHREGGQPGAGTRSAGGPASGQVVWVIEIQPTSAEDLTLSLDGGRPCHEAGAICTADGRTLSKGISTTVKGPSSLTASFQDVPETHDGETPFTFRVAFSEDIDIGIPALREDAFTITGGTVTDGQRVDDRHDLFEVRVEPNSGGDVTITLPAGRDCSVSGAICTTGQNRRLLSNSPTAKVAGPANAPATGAPTISGTAQVGETLTAGITAIADADGLSGESFTYQWVSGDGTTDTDMENATGSTYTLAAADQGRFVKVRVTFTDEGGNEETLTSAPTAPVWGDGPPGAPRNLAATPGNKEVTLSWEPPDDNGNAPATGYRIEWRVDGKDYDKNIWGTARSTSYTTNDQANLANGVKYFFRVKAGNGSGYSYGPYGPASGEVSATPTSGSAVDLGTPVLSNTENLHHGMVRLDWEDVEDAGWYVVQYYHLDGGGGEWVDLPAAGVDIAFHGSSAVVSNLHGLSWLRVRAMSCAGASEWSQIEQSFGTNASDWEGVPVPEVAEGDEIEPCPVVLGTPVLSDTETLHHGMVQLDWEDIEDAGWYVVQYYHVDGGSGEWLDLPAAGVDIAFHGSSAVVSNLHGLSWLRVRAMSCAGESEWSQIEQSFGTNASDWEGVPVPEVEEGDEIEPCSEDADTPDNSPATGAPTIGGTAQVGQTLTSNTSGIADADGLTNVSFTYQWLADDTDIAGASGSTYTLTDSEESKAIKVEVSFTDDAGNDETLTTAATDAVAAASTPNSPATGAPTISGTIQVGETLTADTSGVSDADGLSSVQYEYQWLADDSDISGATNATYTLTDSEESKAITVQVSFTDDADNEETLTSAATDVVAGTQPTEPPDKPTGLEATATHDSVTLTWDDPGDDSITGYVILRRIPGVDSEGHFDVLVADTGTAATTYTDNTVAAETRYTYRIKAINGAGTSERSRWSHIDTPAAPVPDKPTGLEATESHGQVVLTWDDPQDDSIIGYVILRRVRENNTGGDFSVLVADTGSAATTYTDDTVAAGATYTYRIKAINEHGTSERSRWYHIDIPAAP